MNIYKRIAVGSMCAMTLFIGVSFKYEQTIDIFTKENSNLKIQIEERDKVISSQKEDIIVLENIIEKTSDQHMKYLGKFKLSFYSKEEFPGTTYTGVMPQSGVTVAVDPNLVPLNSALYIDGFGVKLAQDTGGAIKGNKIDVFVDTTEEAVKLGVRKDIDVWIIE